MKYIQSGKNKRLLPKVLSSFCSCSDFEDMSCDMVYGQVPPPFEEDPVSKQPCFTDICKFLELLYNIKSDK